MFASKIKTFIRNLLMKRGFIEINEEDLRTVEQAVLSSNTNSTVDFIEIGEEDLVPDEFIHIRPEDLPRILNIDAADLPPIISIDEKDLPPDLSFMETECYHGTSYENALKIQRDGFRVGPGSASGSGIYFSVGAIGYARSYQKSSKPCLIRARVNWGKVAYIDKVPELRGSGDPTTRKALAAEYNSILLSSKFSKENPTVGIVLALKGEYVKSPRITVLELINPRTGKPY